MFGTVTDSMITMISHGSASQDRPTIIFINSLKEDVALEHDRHIQRGRGTEGWR